MGIALLKRLNQNMPDIIKIIFSGLIRSRLIKNDIFVETYNFLENANSFDNSEINEYVISMTKKTLIHAYEHTQYYKKLFDQIGLDAYSFSSLFDMQNIPYLNKQIILQHFDELQADDITDFYCATTGGSSGTPLTVYLDKESIYKERAFVYHYWSKFGYDFKKSKVASFRGTDFNGQLFRYNPLYKEIQCNPCSINDSTIEKYVARMDSFGVEFIHGFPSAVYCFCQHIKNKGINIRGKYKAYFAISENLYPYQKEYIEEVLGCKCAPFYGHTERNVFAEMCDNGYRFNPLYGLVEINNNDNSIVCTGFLNGKMPLIRYNVDDTAIQITTDGDYQITGHRTGILYGYNGEFISAAALEVHSELLEEVVNYQFLKNEVGKATVFIVPFKNLSDEKIEALNNLFQTKVGAALDISVECVDELIHTNRGKTELIIENVKK